MRGFRNWTFDEIVRFLKQNGFVEIKVDGSHHIFTGIVNGSPTVTEVQYHADANGVIKEGTLRDGIVPQSRIPAEEWRAYTLLSPALKKKYVYKGCK